MSQVDEGADRPGTSVMRFAPGQSADAWADLRPALRWIEGRRPVILAGFVLVVAQLAWRWQFLSQMFFRQGDIASLDLARRSGLSWHYLTLLGPDQVTIGQRALSWLVVQSSLYSWTLASVLSLVLLACADLAAFRLLRALFGERPSVLALLAVYLLYPLALPAFGYWTTAIESLPLQIAIFMALHAHVRYIQTQRARHLGAAAGWLAVGLGFAEQGLILPVLLFAVTAGFLAGDGSWLAGAARAGRRYSLAWLAYGALVACDVILLAVSSHSATAAPQLPHSAGAVWTYSLEALKDTFLPGAIGGPWRWLPTGGTYALAAPPAALVYLALAGAVIVVVASALRRRVAWRAWATLLAWLIVADLLPVILTRLNGWFPILLALDTRFLAESGAVLVICLGLACLPLAGEGTVATSRAGFGRPAELPSQEQAWRALMTSVLVLFVLGSVWSAHAYQGVVNGHRAAAYLANAKAAAQLAGRGTPVVLTTVPAFVIAGPGSSASAVIGRLEPGKLRWVARPAGTIDGLRAFGQDGRLYQAFVYGVASVPLPNGKNCWPVRHGQVVVRFWRASPGGSGTLRIGYLLLAQAPVQVNVSYGTILRSVTMRPGLHTAYLPVTGSAASVAMSTGGAAGVCIGDLEAGSIRPALNSSALPERP